LFVRAWVVLTEAGKQLSDAQITEKLDKWVKQRLSRHKWLTGGVEVVDEVGWPLRLTPKLVLTFCRFHARRQARC
jgi:hypothetical protein